ncbi:MAG: hypothetical protein AAFY60_20740, partial [Myxococcota bacterium]
MTFRTATALCLAAALGACTPQTKKAEPPPEKAAPEETPKAEAPVVSKTVAVTAFTGPDGDSSWYGTLLADHITRRLQVPSEGEPPLYVFGWRQAMAAARSIDVTPDQVESRSADLLVELGVDHLVVGSYALDGNEASVSWKIISANG